MILTRNLEKFNENRQRLETVVDGTDIQTSTSAPSSFFANEGRSVPHRPLSAKPRKGSCSREPSEDLPRSTSAPDLLQCYRTGDVRSAAGMAGFSASSAGGSVRSFQLSPSSVLKIQKGDITIWSVDGLTDAIVNATNQQMHGDGGVDEAIHRAAGPELLKACQKVPHRVRCPTGEARITLAFRLPVSHVIHTVGPFYYNDEHPEISLTNAYRNSLKLAKENNVQYIAFPAISCGAYGYPFKEASRIAISVAKEFLDSFKEIHFVLFSDKLYDVWLITANADIGLQLVAKKTLSLTSSFAPVFALPDLPYDYNALEPAISGEIMKIHHQKHHQTYITNYNNALEQLDAAIAKGNASAVVQLQSAIKFNGGGHVNHTIFWQNLKPTNEGGGEPPHSTLGWAIETNFGSLEALIQKMNAEGAALQGSGWVWLALDKGSKKLSVETTANQDPLVTKGATLVPLLGIDVWEHAYYLQYKNVRPDYLKNIWKVINWKYASEVYDKETA